MDADRLLSADGIEERAEYYSKWAADIRAMNGTSVDADHSEQTAFVLRALLANSQSLTRELEEAKEVRDAMGAWAVQFLATDPAVGSVEAAAPYVQEIIRKNRAELRSIRAAKVGVDLSRARSDSTETEAPAE